MKKTPKRLNETREKEIISSQLSAFAFCHSDLIDKKSSIICPACKSKVIEFPDLTFRCKSVICTLFLVVASGSQLSFDF